jgi:hypothetical protein
MTGHCNSAAAVRFFSQNTLPPSAPPGSCPMAAAVQETLGDNSMDVANRSALRAPQKSVFDVMRPVVRILRASGVGESSIRSATARACRQYARNPTRGVQLEHVPFLELADIVMVWARDPEFIDETGSPMKLRLTGPASFESLLRKAGVSIRADSALEQLEALGSVQRCDRGRRVRLVSNVLLTVRGKQFVVGPLLDSIRRFLETIEHNFCEAPPAHDGRMHRWAFCSSLDPDQFAEAQRFVRLSGQAFLDAVDEKLGSCTTVHSRKSGRPYGVGVYVFVDSEPTRPARVRRARR